MVTSRPFNDLGAFVDLVGMACYKEQELRRGAEFIRLEPGDIFCSIHGLSRKWGWGSEKTRRFLQALQKDGRITFHSTPGREGYTVVRLQDWTKYQLRGRKCNPARLLQPDGEPMEGTSCDIKNRKCDIKRDFYSGMGSQIEAPPVTFSETLAVNHGIKLNKEGEDLVLNDILGELSLLRR
jgi:hypothetical protein